MADSRYQGDSFAEFENVSDEESDSSSEQALDSYVRINGPTVSKVTQVAKQYQSEDSFLDSTAYTLDAILKQLNFLTLRTKELRDEVHARQTQLFLQKDD